MYICFMENKYFKIDKDLLIQFLRSQTEINISDNIKEVIIKPDCIDISKGLLTVSIEGNEK